MKEVADLLLRHGDVRGTLAVEADRDGERVAVLTVQVPLAQGGNGQELERAALLHDADYLSGICQVRMFADKYDVDAQALERVLARRRK